MKKFFAKHPKKIRMSDLDVALSTFWHHLRGSGKCGGPLKFSADAALPLSRAVLACYGKGNEEEMEHLASLFRTRKGLERCCAKLIGETLNVPNWRNLIEKPRRLRNKI
jgi:hypothetical protein